MNAEKRRKGSFMNEDQLNDEVAAKVAADEMRQAVAEEAAPRRPLSR